MSIVIFLSIAAWIYLLWGRGGFWRADQVIEDSQPAPLPVPGAWPTVAAVIPARDEAATVGRTVASLLAQDYPGGVSVVLVDDNSTDGTREAAGTSERLSVIAGATLAPGWTGKLWAVSQGLAHLDRTVPEAKYVLLTDGDIEHDPGNLRRLVAKAESGGLDLVSLMVRLNCEGFWEKLLIPAFVFFFQKLHPFPRVNDPARPEAAAAGGCMLVNRRALQAAGGIAAIHDQVIDDCALARLLKARGAVWLGLARRTRSLRAYDRLGQVWSMVARTAYAQLNHSPGLLVATVAGMAVIYLAPPVAVAAGISLAGAALLSIGGDAAWGLSIGGDAAWGLSIGGDAAWGLLVAGLAAWGLMTAAYLPTLRAYGLAAPWALALPVAAVFYTLMTFDSARGYFLGRGGAWKGRTYSGG